MVNGKGESLRAAATYSYLARPLTVAQQALQVSAAQGHLSIVNNAKMENWTVSEKIKRGYYGSLEQSAGLKNLLVVLDDDIAGLKRKESHAAVDSELSMILYDSYPLHKFAANEARNRLFWNDVRVMMVSRLDGPSAKIAKELVDRAIAGEKKPVKGKAYFDQRVSYGAQNPHWPALYDKSLADAAHIVRRLAGFEAVVENTAELFGAGLCRDTAIYCGWYSLEKYVPAFTFVDGAVGYHIASFEAVNLRDEKTTQWCASMLKAGITATIGAVAEPYLHAFPEPEEFFTELLGDNCLAEAYYKTLPFNSWQVILIGDPLYKFRYAKEH